MSKSLEELSQLRKTVDPEVLVTVLLDEVCGRLEEVTKKLDKIGAFVTFMGPMTRMFKRGLQYQYATVEAGGHKRVYYLENPQPELLVGVITEVANDWYAHTHLEWVIDYLPKRVDYVIADVEHPKEYERGIPFDKQVEWIAYNDDVGDHAFGVLMDGFFIDRNTYSKIIGEE